MKKYNSKRRSEYYFKNKEKIKKQQKIRYENNKEKILEYCKIYRENHKEQYKSYRIKTRILWDNFITELGYIKCALCGYDKCKSALEFHHEDPNKKEICIANIFNRNKSFNEENKNLVINETSKCIYVCSNCHRELHYLGRR